MGGRGGVFSARGTPPRSPDMVGLPPPDVNFKVAVVGTTIGTSTCCRCIELKCICINTKLDVSLDDHDRRGAADARAGAFRRSRSGPGE